MRLRTNIAIYILLTFIPVSSFARDDIFNGGISRIVALGNSISQENNGDIRNALYAHRKRIVDDISKFYYLHLPRIVSHPMLDVSRSYRLLLQKYSLSCEIVALRMIIESITHKSISEDRILSHISLYSGPMSESGVWFDPDFGFVGSYTGSQRMHTGYGIYEAPLADYLLSHGIESQVFNANYESGGITPEQRLTFILQALSDNRILLWGDYCTSPLYDDGIVTKIDKYVLQFFPISGKNYCDRPPEDRIFSWKTQEGKEIKAVSGEHAFILLGYVGSIIDPTYIIVWDTSTGKHYYETSEWMRKWKMLDYRTLIVKNILPNRW